MRKKKDLHVIGGIFVIMVIVLLAFIGFKQFGDSIDVPQVGQTGITNTEVKALPAGSLLVDKKDVINMKPVQVIKKENGLIIEVTQEGTGAQVKTGDIVSVDYRGYFKDGKVFDESYKRGQQFSFTPGEGQVIAGWEEGVLGMKVGEKRRLTVPSTLGYGPNDYGPIPGGSTLIFDIELHKIN